MNVSTRLVFLTLLLLQACDTPLGLKAHIGPARQTALRATLQTSNAGQVLSLSDLSSLPAGLRTAQEIRAILDNSNSLYTVVRNADGSLSIPLPAGRQPDSRGKLDIILSDEKQQTYFLSLDTGPLLRLGTPAIKVNRSAPLLPGSRIEFSLNPENPETDLKNFRFNWAYGTSAQGPWTALSGTGSRLVFEPQQAGNYYLKIETTDINSLASSLYISPVAVLTIGDSRRIAQTEPSSGTIQLGQTIQLKANLPETAGIRRFLWSYSQSPVGPFQPIAREGERIDWEPRSAGSYYLRIQAFPEQGEAAVYTSADTLVQVSEADNMILTEPTSGTLIRGETITLSATQPLLNNTSAQYRWFWSSSPQGPFSAIPAEGARIQWSPESTGEFYVRVRISQSETQQEQVFTSSKALVSVRDSDASFELSPQPATLIRGQSVNIQLKSSAQTDQVAWFYGPSAQGPFTSIPGQQSNTLTWSPGQAGSYYLRAEVSPENASKSIYTSATALVTVSEGVRTLQIEPASATTLGSPLKLTAQTPLSSEQLLYTWSYSTSALGPWFPVQTLSRSPQSASVDWYPPLSGSFYLKTDVSDPSGNLRQSFVSPTALAFVNDTPAFFQTAPTPASISTQGAVQLSTRFIPPGPGFIYAWSYAPAQSGPFTAIGGSQQPQITWQQPGVAGNYYIRFDAIDTLQQRSISFVSPNPLVFVSESKSSTPGF